MFKENFLKGLRSGIPIGLGYLSVSFSFGIMAVSAGLHWWQAILISMTNLTSAGQLAGVGIMALPYHYVDMALSQLTINVRYSFMSISLSQKADGKLSGLYRWAYGFFITDEIFAVAVSQKSVTRSFMSGLIIFPYLGWSLGTTLGALLGNILPASVMSALCIALYSMFIAIVAPDCVKNTKLLLIGGVAAALSCAFAYIPILSQISGGISICITAIISAVFGALLFPIEEGDDGQ